MFFSPRPPPPANIAKHVLTGGPGTGKSTLLEALVQRGYATVPEAARTVIETEQARAAQDPSYFAVVPWKTLRRFQALVRDQQMTSEYELAQTAPRGATAFLDRSLVDQYAYAKRGNFDLGRDHDFAVMRARYGIAFLLQPLPTYTQDDTRREDAAHARALHAATAAAYRDRGFTVVDVPVFDGGNDAAAIQRNLTARVAYIESSIAGEPHREKELKCRTEHTPELRERLSAHGALQWSVDTQRDTYFDAFGALASHGYALRVRTGNDCVLTLKGPRREGVINDRAEYEMPLPRSLAHLLQLFPAAREVRKTRSVYHPRYTPAITIALDRVEGVGEFVEIEAPYRCQIDQWQERLALPTTETRSYRELVAA